MEVCKFAKALSAKRCVVGFDGFIDIICHAVDKRFGYKTTDFSRIGTISELSQRVQSAAGKSTNIELVHCEKRLGGNGPILCNTLQNFGLQTTYIGTLGIPIADVFQKFAEKNNAITIGHYGETHALEFDDGKILLGSMNGILEADIDALVAAIDLKKLTELFAECDLVAITNWTMMPHLTKITQFLRDEVFAKITRKADRIFFFDLADPAKRPVTELHEMLDVIVSCASYGRPVLGLNLNEARQVAACLGEALPSDDTEKSVANLASAISRKMSNIDIFIHTNKMSSAANGDVSTFVTGYECAKPVLSTGAGDNFNAGFLAALLSGYSLQAALHCGSAAASTYVAKGCVATVDEMINVVNAHE